MIPAMISPTATARGVRGDVAGGHAPVTREATPGALLPPGCRPETRVHLHGDLDCVLAANEELVRMGYLAREVAR